MENMDDLKYLAEILVEEAGYVGLRINESKTKYLQANRRGAEYNQIEPLKVNEFTFQMTEQFPYLKVTLT